MQLYRLSSEQQEVVKQRLIEVSQQLVNAEFTDPAQDQRMIRFLAYQKGKFDMLRELLEDNFPETDYTQPEA